MTTTDQLARRARALTECLKTFSERYPEKTVTQTIMQVTAVLRAEAQKAMPEAGIGALPELTADTRAIEAWFVAAQLQAILEEAPAKS